MVPGACTCCTSQRLCSSERLQFSDAHWLFVGGARLWVMRAQLGGFRRFLAVMAPWLGWDSVELVRTAGGVRDALPVGDAE